jgi:broad specificity phosphatase PhoE
VGPGAEIVEDARFCEVARPGEPFDDDVLDRRRAWVEGRLDRRHDDWELPGEAAERFHRGVMNYDRSDPIVIATHGMVLTAWLVAIGEVSSGRPAGGFWRSMTLPLVITLSFDRSAQLTYLS